MVMSADRSLFLFLLFASLTIHLAVGLAFSRQSRRGFSLYLCHSQQPTASSSISYRNLQLGDIPSVAELCSDIFDGGEGWRSTTIFDEGARAESISGHTDVLTQRFRTLILKEESITSKAPKSHAMIVATDPANNGRVCGFLEVGLLPSPVPLVVRWGGAETTQVKDVPYLGNVLVSKAYRRRGIGTRLIRVGLKVAEKWQDSHLWLAVDTDNTVAAEMYVQMGFESVVDERTLATRRNPDKVPRIFMRKPVK